MFSSARSRRSTLAGLAVLTLITGTSVTVADDGAVMAALSDSRTVVSKQRAKSTDNAKRQLGLIGGRLESTRGARLEGRNLNASTFAMRFSGETAEDSATFSTKNLLAPEKKRRTPRTAFWFGGNITLDSARAEKPRFASVYTDGLAFGMDARLGPRLVVGNAVGMAFDRTGVGSNGSLETRYLSNTLYGSLTTSTDTYLDVAVGASRGSFLNEQGADSLTSGYRPASQAFGLARYSRLFRHDRLRLKSYGQANYLWTLFDSCSTNGGAHLSSYSAQALELTLGLRGETSTRTRVGKVEPHAVLEVSRAFKASEAAIASFEGLTDMVASTNDRSGRLAARTGLNWTITDRASINSEYAVSSAIDQFAPKQSVTAGFKLKF